MCGEIAMSFVGRFQTVLRTIPAYVDFRRWQKEGFLHTFRRHRLWRQILTSNPVRTSLRSSRSVEVHILCYRLDYLSAIWALKSFYWTSGVDFPLVIHVNGAFEKQMFTCLRTHFPDATLVSQEDADRIVGKRLTASGFARLALARKASPFMIKLTDFPLLAEGATVLGIDSDVLFFDRPSDLIEMAVCPIDGYLFQRDVKSTYNTTPDAAMALFGIQLAPCVNTGLMVYSSNVPNMEAFERYLQDPTLAIPNGFIEQTLYALHASEIERIKYLPNAYCIDHRANLSWDGIVARHYAGPTRHLLTKEGMPRIISTGLLNKIVK